MDPQEIRALRGALSQEDFAALLGVTVFTVCRWETGRFKPSRLALAALGALSKKQARKVQPLARVGLLTFLCFGICQSRSSGVWCTGGPLDPLRRIGRKQPSRISAPCCSRIPPMQRGRPYGCPLFSFGVHSPLPWGHPGRIPRGGIRTPASELLVIEFSCAGIPVGPTEQGRRLPT